MLTEVTVRTVIAATRTAHIRISQIRPLQPHPPDGADSSSSNKRSAIRPDFPIGRQIARNRKPRKHLSTTNVSQCRHRRHKTDGQTGNTYHEDEQRHTDPRTHIVSARQPLSVTQKKTTTK